MANVRTDTQGVPKAAVFEHQSPVVHREDLTAVDASDPVNTSTAVTSDGWEVVDFDLEITLGGTDPILEVAPIFYNPTAEKWFKGESEFFTASGKYRLRAEARGAITFLKMISLDGTNPTMAVDVWASLS